MIAAVRFAFGSVVRARRLSRFASTAATVLYGSQTGNAMGFAMQLNEALSERGESTVCDLYDYKGPALLEAAKLGAEAPLHVFVVSCFGKGEPSDSAKKFWAWLFAPERDAEHAASVAAGTGPLLRGLPFTVFGLGSSQTHSQHYQIVGRKLDDRLAGLGGSRRFVRGEGDDSGVLELDFEAWQAKLMESLKAGDAGTGTGSGSGAAAAPATLAPAAAATAAPAPAEAAAAAAAACAVPAQKPVEFGGRAWSETAASAYISRPTASGAPATFFRIVPQPTGDAAAFAALDSLPPLSVLSATGERGMVPLPVTATSTLSPLGGRESRPVVELTFDMAAGAQASPPLPLSYITGDHVSVMPEADDAAVLALCERCNWDPELPFVLKPPAATCETGPTTATAATTAAPQQRMPLPGATTVRNALKRHVDVGASLSPAMLRLLAAHAGDAGEAAALQRLASDAAAYKGAVRGRFIRLLDALFAFPSVRLPLDRLLASWPILTPRYYSISSSSAAPDSAECAPAALAATLAAVGGSAGEPHVSTAASGRRSMMLTFKHLRYALAAGAPGSDAALEKGAAAADAAIAEWHSRGIGRAISHGLPASTLAGPGGRVWSGLASSFMATRRPGDAVTVAVRPSSFRLPADPSRPQVWIAGGIGVAPFRAFLEERIYLAMALGAGTAGSSGSSAGSGSRLGRATLLYGCRGAYDHVYAGLAREAVACGALTEVDVGYGDGGAAPEPAGEGSPEETALRAAYMARGDGRAGRPVLADELVLRHADAVWEALTQGGAVYVCGGATGFGAAVSRAVTSIIMTRAGMTEAAAQEHLFRCVEEGRFVEDLAD